LARLSAKRHIQNDAAKSSRLIKNHVRDFKRIYLPPDII
jgi:hypothetical protein